MVGVVLLLGSSTLGTAVNSRTLSSGCSSVAPRKRRTVCANGRSVRTETGSREAASETVFDDGLASSVAARGTWRYSPVGSWIMKAAVG